MQLYYRLYTLISRIFIYVSEFIVVTIYNMYEKVHICRSSIYNNLQHFKTTTIRILGNSAKEG